jgi:hypothetical protein
MNTFHMPELKDRLTKVVAFARQESDKTNAWTAEEAELRIIGQDSTSEELTDTLQDVDILVNA